MCVGPIQSYRRVRRDVRLQYFLSFFVSVKSAYVVVSRTRCTIFIAF